MIKKTIKTFIAFLIIASSLLVFSSSTPVNADGASSSSTSTGTPKYVSFKVSSKTYYAGITYKKSSNKCSTVNFYQKSSGKYKKLSGSTLTKAKNSTAGKKAKKSAEDWCKNQQKTNKKTNTNTGGGSSTTGGGSSNTGGGSSTTGGSTTTPKNNDPAVVDTGPSDICNTPNVPDSVKAASGCNSGGGGNSEDLTGAIYSILQNIILVSSTVAVIFIIIGGIQYMTSAGDANKTKKGRDTILYACIGLIICALAFAIVNFTIGLMSGDNSKNNTNNSLEEADDSSEE